jgi:putative transposase
MPSSAPAVSADLSRIPESAWAEANARFATIEPLLNHGHSRAVVEEQAKAVGVNVSTLYRWLKKYRKSRLVADLLPTARGVHEGDTRLNPEPERIVSEVIQKSYLHKQKPSIRKVCDEVAARCRQEGIEAPHSNTIRRRIARLPARLKTKEREGSRKAEQDYGPKVGQYPQPTRPFEDVQIDHTKLDIILVDEVHRQPIGRPWITLAIDIFSRMVAGFYISFDSPGALSTGLCLFHAVLPKELWLAKHCIDNTWPIHGRIEAVQCDNAREFHGSMLDRACQNYGIRLHWRPVKKPWYGGHIEALLGTLNEEIKRLPGTTFSNPGERGEYDSDGQAAFTLTEFEKWLATYITGQYHQRCHSALSTSPLQKYESAAAAQKERDWKMDEFRLRMDFMPYVERSVKPYGLVVDQVTYYADVLRPWINVVDPKYKGHKFIVRRDPRDISIVYFYDPELNRHFPIPYRNTAHPPISVWELRDVRRRLKEQGRSGIHEDLIFETYARMREMEAQARRSTRSARREEQRRRDHTGVHQLPGPRSPEPLDDLIADPTQVSPFDEIEELS